MTKKVTVHTEIDIAAPMRDVYEALTEAPRLEEWFCEHADVALEEGRFDFWGRFTPGTPDRDGGRHPVLAFEPGRLVRFAWPVLGAETIAELSLREEGSDRTVLAVKHQDVPAWEPGQIFIDSFWENSLENLRAILEGASPGPRDDYSVPARGDIVVSVDIGAAPAEVFRALLDPDAVERWMGEGEVSIDPRVGGRYDVGWKEGGPVEIVRLEPDRELAYSWTYEGEEPTVVTWTLEGSGGTTRLTLVHSGFDPERRSDDYRFGWQSFLNRVKFVVERGTAWTRPRHLASSMV